MLLSMRVSRTATSHATVLCMAQGALDEVALNHTSIRSYVTMVTRNREQI